MNLTAHLQQSGKGFDVVPLVDVTLVVLFMFLSQSEILIAPGVAVALPEVSGELTSANQTAAILTVSDADLMLFNGGTLRLTQLEDQLHDYRERRTNPPDLLLVKLDRNSSIALFGQIAESARAAGFTHVSMAIEMDSAPASQP